MLFLCGHVEHTPPQKQSLHASGRGEVIWFDRDRLGPTASVISHFQVVMADYAVIQLGMAEAFEGDGRF